MGRVFGNQSNLDEWRALRARRSRRDQSPVLARKPTEARPPGTPTPAAVRRRAKAKAAPPIAKHVPRNTHRAGSIAYGFLYSYWLPGQ